MTSLEKAINLGYLFLTLTPHPTKKINTCTTLCCIYWYVSIYSKSVFDSNTCILNLVPLMNTVDVQQVNCPVWGWNNSGCRRPDVEEFLHGGGTGGPTIWIGDVGEVYNHWQYAGRLTPPGDNLNDGAAADTAGGRELGLPTIGDGGSDGGHEGGRDVFLPLPEQSFTVHYDHTHYESVSDSDALPWGAGVPAAMGTGGNVPGGKTGRVKGGGNGGGI